MKVKTRIHAHPLHFIRNNRNHLESRPIGNLSDFKSQCEKNFPDEIEIFYTERTGKAEVFVYVGMKDKWHAIYKCLSENTYQLLLCKDN